MNEEIQIQPGGDEPSVDLAASVGGAALTEEEQADLMLDANDPNHPRGNEEMAHEMANSMIPTEQMINNIMESSIPDKQNLVETLQKQGEQLAKSARERYVRENAQYKKLSDSALGNLLDATSEQSPHMYRPLFEVLPRTRDGSNFYEDTTSHDELSPAIVERVEEEIFTVAGVRMNQSYEKIDWMALPVDNNGWRNWSFDTNLGNDTRILEQRIYDNGANSLEPSQIRFAIVGKDYQPAKQGH